MKKPVFNFLYFFRAVTIDKDRNTTLEDLM